MLTIRDLPAVIERAIPMPPHATIGQGVAVERLRAVTEAQVREVIEAERAGAESDARASNREIVRLEAEVEELRARYRRATAGSHTLRPGEAKKLTESLDSRMREVSAEAKLARIRDAMDAAAEKQARNRERLNGGVGLLEPVDLMADLHAILDGDNT